MTCKIHLITDMDCLQASIMFLLSGKVSSTLPLPHLPTSPARTPMHISSHFPQKKLTYPSQFSLPTHFTPKTSLNELPFLHAPLAPSTYSIAPSKQNCGWFTHLMASH